MNHLHPRVATAKDTTDILPVIVPAVVTPDIRARTQELESRNWKAWYADLNRLLDEAMARVEERGMA
jgi:hypothetical protein